MFAPCPRHFTPALPSVASAGCFLRGTPPLSRLQGHPWPGLAFWLAHQAGGFNALTSASAQSLKASDVSQVLRTACRLFVRHEMPQRKHVEGDATDDARHLLRPGIIELDAVDRGQEIDPVRRQAYLVDAVGLREGLRRDAAPRGTEPFQGPAETGGVIRLWIKSSSHPATWR